MNSKLFITLVLNVGVLLIISGILADIKYVRVLLLQKDEKIQNKIVLGVMFGIMSIVSTYLGLGVQGAIVNTRVIGVLASGILGGPVVGIITAVIAGTHRYFYDVGGFTSFACSVSTIVEGLIGAATYRYYQNKKMNPFSIGIIAVFAEITQMVIILILARPFSDALALVKMIALPMIVINSLGSILFFSTFNRIFIERESEISNRLCMALHIAEQSLPHLRNGLQSEKSMQEVVNNICVEMPEFRAIITSSSEVIADSNKDQAMERLPGIAMDAIRADTTVIAESAAANDPLYGVLNNKYAIAAPLKESNVSVGALVILVRKQWLTMEANKSFVSGLANLFSTMLELSNISYEISMRRRAEFIALQSQINPHFLYNALNTLSSVCREDPERTRELLIILGNYFRHTLEMNQEFIPLDKEINAVKGYLELEYARFEDKLHVTWDVTRDEKCILPPLILQPIVENAVKHGADDRGYRDIGITIQKKDANIVFTVSDKGNGFKEKDMNALLNDENKFSGIFNVHKRLKSIYEGNEGLSITSSGTGASVSFVIPGCGQEVSDEDCDN